MTNERFIRIEIDGEEHHMLLSVKATEQINEVFGGLDKIGEQLEGGTPMENLKKVIQLLTILINAAASSHNRKSDDKWRTVTEEELADELTPGDLKDLKDAIMATLLTGAGRTLGEGKNA